MNFLIATIMKNNVIKYKRNTFKQGLSIKNKDLFCFLLLLYFYYLKKRDYTYLN